MDDLICAIATPKGSAGVAIIRISGEGAVDFIAQFCKRKIILNVPFNTIYLDQLIFENEMFDEVLLSKFERGKSYTGDEVVEINCHGGNYVTTRLLTKLLNNHQIRLAEPGEFTKRAFLNGKISLNKAQGLMDLINSHNGATHKMALRSFDGDNLSILETTYSSLKAMITQISVGIDYPEYEDIEELVYKDILVEMKSIADQIESLLVNSNRGQILKDGISCAIVGQPNVGKSTLLNLLSNTEKAIVTDIPGTTRDIIESEVVLGDLKLNLKDTAGIRETDDYVEEIGIALSMKMIEESEFIIFITDSTESNKQKDVELYKNIQSKKHIVLNNKSEIGKYKHIEESIDVSLKDISNLKIIEAKIKELFDLDSFDADNSYYLNNLGHISKLNNAYQLVLEVVSLVEIDESLDIIEINLKEIIYIIGDILGLEAKNDIINEMFSRFCLGK